MKQRKANARMRMRPMPPQTAQIAILELSGRASNFSETDFFFGSGPAVRAVFWVELPLCYISDCPVFD